MTIFVWNLWLILVCFAVSCTPVCKVPKKVQKDEPEERWEGSGLFPQNRYFQFCIVWPTYFQKIKYKQNFYQVRLMLFYGTIFKIIKYKNLKIKYSIQIYQVHLAILTEIKYNTWKSSAVGHTSSVPILYILLVMNCRYVGPEEDRLFRMMFFDERTQSFFASTRSGIPQPSWFPSYNMVAKHFHLHPWLARPDILSSIEIVHDHFCILKRSI